MKRGLFLKYVVLLVGLVTGVLLINAALDLYFVYQDNRRASIEVQKEKAEAAAQRIESFVREIQRQIGWVAYPQFETLPMEQRRFDYNRLQRLVPAITELALLDRAGHEQLKISRVDPDSIASNLDRSQEPAFVEARKNKVYFSPVYFRKESEPYLAMAVAHGRGGGVTVADVNLKFILGPISEIKVGKEGYAYVVDRLGRLIAHPDISLVLRGTDMKRLPQVEAALGTRGDDGQPVNATNRAGVPVLSAHAAIPALNWLVFVELPTAEAQKPVINAGMRALGLLVLGLIIAGLSAALLARRMLVPIRALQAGAERIGGGDLGHRLSIKTGDELEGLANQFNRSASALQDSYATLEQRVEQRTQALTRSVEELTASSEILRLIASAPDDLVPMFDTLLNHATRLCGAQYGILWLGEPDGMVAVALRNVPAAYASYLKQGVHHFSLNTAVGQTLATLRPVQVQDVRAGASTDPMRRATVDLGGARTLLTVPMLRKEQIVGVLAIFRQEVQPFDEAQIRLVTTFADQAVIAIENTRLLRELRARTTELEAKNAALGEALEQQTATADILRVISQSPTDVKPVMEAVATAARRFCGAANVGVILRDGAELFAAAHDGSLNPAMGRRWPVERTTVMGRCVAEGRTVHVEDLLSVDPLEYPLGRALAEELGHRATLGVPMLREGSAIGCLLLRKPEAVAFTPHQIQLAETFAAQAVIAIENVRLFTELRESLEQQTATAEVLRVISQSPTDVQPVLDVVVQSARRFCATTDALIILREGDDVVIAAHDGSLTASLDRRRLVDRGGAPERAMLDGVTLQIPDADLLDPNEHALTLARSRQHKWRSGLVVPMMREGMAAGAIMLRRTEPGTFTPRQVELAETFAAQAVIAIENARLFSELRNSLEQQTATAEVLRVISQSPTDVQPVLEVVVQSARRFCDTTDAVIILRDQADSVIAAHDGSLTSSVGRRRPLGRDNLAGRAMLEGNTIQIPDSNLLDPAEYADAVALSREHKWRAALAAPMMREGTGVGAILLRTTEPGAFTPRQIELAETFAAQAVIAIENVRLFTELRESLEQQTATAEVLRVISQSPTDVKPVLNAVAAAARRFCGGDDATIVLHEGTDLVQVAHDGGLALVADARFPLDRSSMVGHATLEGRTIHIPDVNALAPSEYAFTQALSREVGVRSLLAAPMLREEDAIGAIALRRPEPIAFTPRQIELLETFAAQAVIAIENTRLFNEIQEKSHQLEIASQHKSQFLANMSHELRTPLNAIIGYTEMMADGLYGDLGDKAGGVLERVQANSRHLLSLINDVLDLSKIEAGQLVLADEPYSVADIVGAVVAATESLARAKGLEFGSTVAPGLPAGTGDARRLTQVLLNLAGNAIKFTDRGSVEIRAGRSGDRFELSVVDTGPGIAPADQARVFDEFQQVDNSSTRTKGGTGLGLSISRKIVELHGGRLTVESQVGSGSTFTVAVPINAAPLKDAAQ